MSAAGEDFFFGIFTFIGIFAIIFVVLFVVAAIFCFKTQKTILGLAKIFGYTVLNGVFLGVEQVSNSVCQNTPLFVVGYELNDVKSIVKLQKCTVFNGFFGGVKNLQANMSFPLLQKKNTGKISSGLISDIYRTISIVAGVVFLLLSLCYLIAGVLFIIFGVTGAAYPAGF